MAHFHCPATRLNILTPRVTPRALIPRGVWVQTPLKKRKKWPQPMSLARYAGENFANFHSKFCIANPMRGPPIFHFCRNYPCQRIMVSFFEFSTIQGKGQLISKCPFGVFKSSQKNNIFSRISALVSKEKYLKRAKIKYSN